MNIFAIWLTIIEPIVNKAIAIIPHIKEIINIAFKPHNGLDNLTPTEENRLKERLRFIDQKFMYMNKEPCNDIMLSSINRKRIIKKYNEYVKELEECLLSDFLIPLFNKLTKNEFDIIELLSNPFLKFFSEEMEHSFLLPELHFPVNPIKQSIIRSLEEGLDFLIGNHHKFIYNVFGLRKHPGNDSFGRTKIQITKGFSKCISAVSFFTFIWNSIGLREDLFQYQFYESRDWHTFRYILEMCHDEHSKNEKDHIALVSDKLIIEFSIMIRLLQVSSLFDNIINRYHFPQIPLETNIRLIKEREIDYYKGFSPILPFNTMINLLPY